MTEVSLSIGGRDFRVGCEPGEEPNLKQAAALLDAEAQVLEKSIGRVPESRMLLMAGLMLADRAVEVAQRAQAAEAQLEALQASGGDGPARSANVTGAEETARTAAAAVAALERAAVRAEALAKDTEKG